MCGIFGYFSRDGKTLSDDQLRAMGTTLEHRGPDDHGMYSSCGVALGNQRLSIIDVAGGHQPFISDDGQIAVVQNGEIFNYRELAGELSEMGNPCRTGSDTEVLLRLYEAEGIDFINRLNGMFAIAIWDARIGTMHLVRDRIGVKPLFFHDDGNQITFGSEIKAILPALDNFPKPDPVAQHHFLTFNYVPPPFTMYDGIRHVMPGCRMEIRGRQVVTHRWWDLTRCEVISDRSEADWMEEFNDILDDAVRLRMRCDVPYGAFLSGGVDSSSVVGMMARHSPAPIKTFCIGFADPRFDESAFAQAAADRFGADHTLEVAEPDMLELWPKATWHCDQPHGDVSFLPTMRVSQLAAQHVKVVLTGDGGDELFAGYDKHRDFFADEEVHALDVAEFHRRYFESISLFDPANKRALYNASARSALGSVDSFAIANNWFEQVGHQDRINQALYLDMELLLSGNNLVKPDRMGMSASLEARAPFLDYRMMEFAFRMPGHLKLKDHETKYLYKKAVEPLIGTELTYRKKQMFTVPVGEWFKSHLEAYCRKHMASLLEKTDMFDGRAVFSLLDDHVSGAANRTRELRAFIALDHWHSIHQDQSC